MMINRRFRLGCVVVGLGIAAWTGTRSSHPADSAPADVPHAGRAAFRAGDFPRAQVLCEEELLQHRRQPAPARLKTAQLLQNLAVVQLQTGALEAARKNAAEALDLRIAELGNDHPDVATTLNNLGAIEYAVADFEAAEQHLRRAAEIRSATLDAHDPAVAQTLDNLGCLLTATGRHAEAETVLREALAIRTAHNDDPVGLATTTNNLAALHLDRCDPDAAELARQAAALADKAFADDHPARMVVLGNTARSQQRLAAASADFDRAITLATKANAVETPAYAHLLNKIVNYHVAMQDFLPAASVAERALTICHKVFGDRHPATALALNNLGIMAFVGGDPRNAEKLIRESLAINERVLGAEHPAVA